MGRRYYRTYRKGAISVVRAAGDSHGDARRLGLAGKKESHFSREKEVGSGVWWWRKGTVALENKRTQTAKRVSVIPKTQYLLPWQQILGSVAVRREKSNYGESGKF